MPRSSSRQTCVRHALAFSLILLPCAFVSIPRASAAPITLNYVGGIGFYDDTFAPDLRTGFAAHDIYQGTPFTLSMTIDPNAPAVPIVGWPGFFEYPTALLAATLHVGSFTYTVQSSYLGPFWQLDNNPVSGPSVTGTTYGFTYTPAWISFVHPLTNGFTIGNATVWTDPWMMLIFQPNPLAAIVFSQLKLVSVSVPEPSSLVLTTGMLLAFLGTKLRSRKWSKH